MPVIYVKLSAKAKSYLDRAGCVPEDPQRPNVITIGEEAYRRVFAAARREGKTISTLINRIIEACPLKLRAAARAERRSRIR
jgi:hypothetical protein